MKKTKPIASPELTKELLQDSNLVKEYVEYLRSKVKRRDDGVYYCVTKFDGPCRCWDQTERFCKEKGLDFDTVFTAFSLNFGCEAKIANYFDLDAFRKEAKKQKGHKKKRFQGKLIFKLFKVRNMLKNGADAIHIN